MSLEHLRELAVEAVSRLPLSGRRQTLRLKQAEWTARSASHKTRVEDLAWEIVEYRDMMNITGAILIGVPEVACRFRESTGDARAALCLLEANGLARRTEFRDRWALLR